MLGEHILILKKDGTIWGCGKNAEGALGLGHEENQFLPIQLPIDNVKKAVAGRYFSVFQKKDGTIWACGYNYSGQLGVGDRTDRLEPTQVLIENVKDFVCGNGSAFFLKYDGSVWGCGTNIHGELGLGNTGEKNIPTQLPIKDVSKVVCGNGNTYFTKKDGTIWACGDNGGGQLGIGNTTTQKTPVKVPIEDVRSITCGNSQTFFQKNDGSIWGCGNNSYGQLGLGNTTRQVKPIEIPIQNVKCVLGASECSIFLKNDGTLWGCGNNSYGLGLGPASSNEQLNPVQLPTEDVLTAYIAFDFVYYQKKDGTIWSCGYNSQGQLGLGDDVFRNSPQLVEIDNVKTIRTDQIDWLTYLLKDEGEYKTIKGENVIPLSEKELTAEIFMEKGFTSLEEIVLHRDMLSTKFEVLTFGDEFPQGLECVCIPKAQQVLPKSDLHISAFSSITQVSVSTTGKGGVAKIIVSFDQGTTWYTFKDSNWEKIVATAEAVGIGGISYEIMETIPAEKWAEKKSDTIRFAYYLEDETLEDNLAVDVLSISGDVQGLWSKAVHGTDYQYGYPSGDTLRVQLLTEGSYKINLISKDSGSSDGKRRVEDVNTSAQGIAVQYDDNTQKELDTRDNEVAATLFYSEWAGENAPYVFTWRNPLIKTNSVVELAQGTEITAEQLNELQMANILGGQQTDGSIQLMAYGQKPTGNISVKFVIRKETKVNE